MWAQEHGRPFFLVEDLQGIDSAISRVLVMTNDGESFELQLDGYNSYSGVSWTACERFEGPSWRGRAPLSPGIACVPVATECEAIGRVAGRLGPWNCAAGKFPPTLPRRARIASAFLRTPEASGFSWPSAAIETLGRSALDFKVIQAPDGWRCLAPRELTDGPEVWLLSDRWGARYPMWIPIPESAERTYPLRFLGPETAAVVYRAHSERPWPKMFGPCPEIIRTPGTFH
jgi:hypothetical protein